MSSGKPGYDQTKGELQSLEQRLKQLREKLEKGTTIQKSEVEELSRQFGEMLVHAGSNGAASW